MTTNASIGPSSPTDDQFLMHMKRLEESKREAEMERSRLLTEQETILRQLKSVKDERNAAGRYAMELISEEKSIQAKKYEHAFRRQTLEESLTSALSEEIRLREELSQTLDESRHRFTQEELIQSMNRLIEGAQRFETEDFASLSAFHNGPTTLDIDRAYRTVESARRLLSEMKPRLETVRANEQKLREKHRVEQEKANFGRTNEHWQGNLPFS